MKPFLVPIMLVTILTPLSASAAKPPCPRFIDSKSVRIDNLDLRPTPDMNDEHPREGKGSLVCRVAAGGRLEACQTTVTGSRGRWILRQVREWRLVKVRPGRCPIDGRWYRMTLRFELAE